MYIEEKIREGAFETCSPAFVNGKARASNFRGDNEVKDAGTLADFPMRLRRKIKLRRRTPTADFFVISGACAHGHGRMWNIGDGEEKFALRGVEFGDALVGLLDALGNLLHFGNEGISVFLLFLQAGDFLAGFIALRLELLGCGDEFAALFVELAKGVQVKRGATPFRHFGKDIKMISEIVQVMHGVGRIS